MKSVNLKIEDTLRNSLRTHMSNKVTSKLDGRVFFMALVKIYDTVLFGISEMVEQNMVL